MSTSVGVSGIGQFTCAAAAVLASAAHARSARSWVSTGPSPRRVGQSPPSLAVAAAAAGRVVSPSIPRPMVAGRFPGVASPVASVASCRLGRTTWGLILWVDRRRVSEVLQAAGFVAATATETRSGLGFRTGQGVRC
jgi:hypothetical protein